MKPIRRTRHALMFMGAGAIAAYFLDPESGPERRERLLQQAQSLTGQVGSSPGSHEEPASPSSARDSAEPFATSSSSSSTGTDRGPIDLATGEPLSSGNTP